MRRLVACLAVVAAASLLLGACAIGPKAIGLPVSGSSSARWSPTVNFTGVCLPNGGHLKIEFDSTSGVNPEAVAYYLAIDNSPDPVNLDGPTGFHWEHTDLHPFEPGQCAESLDLAPICPTACPAWEASLQTFTYRVSIVP